MGLLLLGCPSGFLSTTHKCGTVCSTATCLHHTTSCLHHIASLPYLCNSAPPTHLDECGFLCPWLLDFHTVRFSVCSGCFLFLNCCCHSFGCARWQCVYLCLHLGWKSELAFLKSWLNSTLLNLLNFISHCLSNSQRDQCFWKDLINSSGTGCSC